MEDPSFTGRGRRRQTRKSVLWAERTAKLFISIGGIGTILAVSLIFFFLLWVITPLFRKALIGEMVAVAAGGTSAESASEIVGLGLGPNGRLAWSLAADGRFEVRSLDSGALMHEQTLAAFEGGPAPTAIAMTPERRRLVLGFADGQVVLGEIIMRQSFLSEQEEGELMPELQALKPGEAGPMGPAILERTPAGQLRRIEITAELEPGVRPSGDVAIQAVDVSELPAGVVFGSLDAEGGLFISTLCQRYNFITDETKVEALATELPYEPDAQLGAPAFLSLDDLGNRMFLGWPDGRVVHYRVDEEDGGIVEEIVDVVPEPGVELLSLTPLLGKGTLIAVDSVGGVSAWFKSRAQEGERPKLVRAHELPGPTGERVTTVATSPRSRVVALGTEEGSVQLIQVTTESELAYLRGALNAPIDQLAISDRQDEVLALAGGELARMELDIGYPEASVASLFGPVWYEGYPGPAHVWQSTSSSDDFEPKLGLTPLVFGTLKATFYSMIFGAPLALLAAIFSSEYLKGRVRSTVKATLELMATLPSVVLGFLAATLIAPMVQDLLPGVLAMFLSLPFALLLGAHLWQLLPRHLSLRWSGWQRLLAMGLAVLLSLPLSGVLAPVLERVFFAGDVEAWLDGRAGTGATGWLFLFLPLSVVVVALLFGRVLQARLRHLIAGRSSGSQARLELAKFLAASSLVVGLAWGLSLPFNNGLGWDPRGGFIGSYDQRNALVVGFVMGFAIIPIIYTLAEDAFTSVPGHLREASLGAGATPWQTAVRVIIPTAMSGLFSALMIGLGRAVGETMIVLMATGGTAIMDWNMFNGFRTLSANIATELPEAVKAGAHYRVLFLAGFVLFVMTFILNTLAEVVRQRFRKRAFQL